MNKIKESDWKKFKLIRAMGHERYCQKTLEKVTEMATETVENIFDQLFDIKKYLKTRSKEEGMIFHDLRRSTALQQLTIMVLRDKITMEEINEAGFSDEVVTMMQYRVDNLK